MEGRKPKPISHAVIIVSRSARDRISRPKWRRVSTIDHVLPIKAKIENRSESLTEDAHLQKVIFEQAILPRTTWDSLVEAHGATTGELR